jgi:hypothetical protein
MLAASLVPDFGHPFRPYLKGIYGIGAVRGCPILDTEGLATDLLKNYTKNK